MPELPEVETIVRDLQRCLEGKSIKSFELFNAKTVNLPARRFARAVTGRKFKKIWRRGKNIVLNLSDGRFLLIHLKMTGQLVWRPLSASRRSRTDKRQQTIAGGHPIVGVGPELPNRFTRAVFGLSDRSQLFFNDVRKFGWIKLLEQEALDKYFSRLGLEPLARDFTLSNFKKILAGKSRSRLKAALMDQRHLAGVGNIYADEALFASRLKPGRQVSGLSEAEIKRLWRAIPQVLRLSLKHRGTSFSDYRDGRGQPGKFVAKLKVYGRGGQPCRRCGAAIKKAKLGGRGTHWCDGCQK